MPLSCEKLPNSFSEVIGTKVPYLQAILPADTKMTKDIFHSLGCDTSQPPFFLSKRAPGSKGNMSDVMLFMQPTLKFPP